MGARVLQCPHQGAKNSTRAGLPEMAILSKLSGMRSRTADLSKLLGGTLGPLARETVARPASTRLLSNWTIVNVVLFEYEGG